jgi:hypothetical protein
MLHACVERFDVMGGRGNILGWEGEVNKAITSNNITIHTNHRCLLKGSDFE